MGSVRRGPPRCAYTNRVIRKTEKGKWLSSGHKFSSRAARNAWWIENYCRIPEGELVGQRPKLTAHQFEWLEAIYDSPTRQFILSMPRKNGKTAFIAFLLLLHLVGPEARRNSQLYSAAQSRDQAAIVFNYAQKMVRLSPELEPHVGIRDSAKQMYCPGLGTVYKALSKESSTAYGLSPAFAVHDELGQVKGPRSELYEAIESAAGAQPEPMSMIISTQAPSDGALLSKLIDDAKNGPDKTIKVRVYEAPLEADPFSEDTIRGCNPHFDEFMNREEVLAQAQRASRMPSAEASFRNLILNQRVEATDPFVSRAVWKENGGAANSLDGRSVIGGLDLSSVSDLTALVLVAADQAPHDVEATFWLPEDGLREKSQKDRVPYDVWAQEGKLQTCPGRTIDYEFVAYELRAVFDRCDVRAIAFDRWGMRHLIPWLERAGFTEDELERFVEFGQGYKDMSPALRQLESMLLDQKLRHGNQPLLTMCAANAVVQQDPAGNRKLAKDRSSGRIDGMVALAMAVGAMSEREDEQVDYDSILSDPLILSY